jgi:hypothetical protein
MVRGGRCIKDSKARPAVSRLHAKWPFKRNGDLIQAFSARSGTLET